MKAGIWIRQAGLCAGLLVTLVAHAAGDATAGKWKANTCLGCHGIENYHSVYPSYRVPKLAGQHGDYLVAALKDYRTGARKHPSMRANAGSLSDQDIHDIASYFSGEPVAEAAAVAAPEQAEAPQAPSPAVPPSAAAPAPAPQAAPAAAAETSAPPAEPAPSSKPKTKHKPRARRARNGEGKK